MRAASGVPSPVADHALAPSRVLPGQARRDRFVRPAPAVPVALDPTARAGPSPPFPDPVDLATWRAVPAARGAGHPVPQGVAAGVPAARELPVALVASEVPVVPLASGVRVGRSSPTPPAAVRLAAGSTSGA
jgi:hypothetical protein